MKLKAFKTEWFQDYKTPSMYLAFPSCTFKCEKDCKKRVCQNGALAQSPDIEICEDILCLKYLSNPITGAMVCGGLEPMDSFPSLLNLVSTLRNVYKCRDDVVIYTGYTEEECESMGWLEKLRKIENIVIKFGRYRPNQTPHFDETLEVMLASDNQYAKRL